MHKRNKAPARIFAMIALVGGFIVVVLVISSSSGGGGATRTPAAAQAGSASGAGASRRALHTPSAYVVKNGDTLTSIAHKTGVSVVRIQALNPRVDPQILVSGQKLKLR
jgi:LysM repeat protein